MHEAIEMAKQNIRNKTGGPFAAIIVKDGTIVGRGTNNVTSKNDSTAHAEIQAIRNACSNLKTFKLDGCEIYTTCEPCPMCLGAIYWAHISKVYYALNKQEAAQAGFNDSFIYQEFPKTWQERSIKGEILEQDEAQSIFKLWQEMEDKIHY